MEKKVRGKRNRENGPKSKKDYTERATGLGRRTREIQKSGIKLTALRFQTGGEDIKHPQLPFGGLGQEKGSTLAS